jgi:hypothetical protein
MKYRVFCSPNAEQQLEVILSATSHTAILAKAARDIDGHLLTDPLSFGESRHEEVRIGLPDRWVLNMRCLMTCAQSSCTVFGGPT